nr:uncharacterized protein LOC124811167 [Hydra vulgaris]
MKRRFDSSASKRRRRKDLAEEACTNSKKIYSFLKKSQNTVQIEQANQTQSEQVETEISLQENAGENKIGDMETEITDPIHQDSNHHFLNKTLTNGETCIRDWLCWSVEKQSLYCAPCFLFNKNAANVSFSLVLPDGAPVEKSASRAALCETSVDNLLLSELKTETENWKKLFQRILDVIIFLSERGLALFGSNQRIGDQVNGNFLGIIELFSKYDPLLAEHVKHVRESQQCKQRMQAHYFSMRIQSEFIDIYGSHVQTAILHEIVKAKFFDATPDCSYKEQTMLLVRANYAPLRNRCSNTENIENFEAGFRNLHWSSLKQRC